MKTLNEIYEATQRLYDQTPVMMPWVDLIGDALNKLQEAVEAQNSFDPVQHVRDIRDQQMQDWGSGE